jgi:hypothetical protein
MGWGDEAPPNGSVVEFAACRVQDLGREIDTSFYAVNNITYPSPHLISRAIIDLNGANSDVVA